ncbi:uncharacterized protein LOC114796731 isoform X2 [Denticeps clupeoides]|uniref:uncharacterized protein LOC114796731 isoform X2 n=1 Tax=Denticeps clupeoides TaxID=299321 RepID=UPI0010A2E0B3|nr:uncharacterized protein LOC114796731 isoform X2 [Denticeps clupeoides]
MGLDRAAMLERASKLQGRSTSEDAGLLRRVRLQQRADEEDEGSRRNVSQLPCCRSSRTSKKADEQCPPSQSHTPAKEPVQPEPSDSDHLYSLDPVKTKKKLTESLDQVEKLRRELRNARDRERRQKKIMRCLLEDLKEKSTLSEELQQKLDVYSDFPVELLKRDHAFTPKQMDFALTLHLHGPKAYSYLRETMKFPLPHPHTLLRRQKQNLST